MRLTEAKLKFLINEEYENILFETSLMEGMEQLTVEDLNNYRITNEDRLDEVTDPVSIIATLVGAFLSAPKVIMLVGKALKNLHKTPIIGKMFKDLDSEENKDKKSVRRSFAKILSTFGGKWHTALVKAFSFPIKMLYKLESKQRGPDFKPPSEKEMEEVGEALMIFVIAICATFGVTTVLGHLLKGDWSSLVTLGETALNAIKGLEIGEFSAKVSGGALPLAFKFLETPHEHDEEH